MPPTINYDNPDPAIELDVVPNTQAQRRGPRPCCRTPSASAARTPALSWRGNRHGECVNVVSEFCWFSIIAARHASNHSPSLDGSLTMRALQLIEDRRLEIGRPAAAAAARAGEVTLRIKAVALNHIDVWGWRGMAFAKRKLPLVIGAEASGEVEAVGPGVAGLLPGPARRRSTARAPAGFAAPAARGRDNLCEHVGGVHGFHLDGFAQEKINLPGAAAGAGPARRRRDRRGGRAGHLRHGRAHAVRQCQAGARRDHPRPCRRLGHRLRGDPARQEIGCTVITTVGSDDKIDKAKALGADHVINYRDRSLRRRGAQAHQEEGRRRRLRACRRRHLGRLDAVPEARRPAGHLRLDLRRVDRRSI